MIYFFQHFSNVLFVYYFSMLLMVLLKIFVDNIYHCLLPYMQLISQHFLKQYHWAIYHLCELISQYYQTYKCLLSFEFSLILQLTKNHQSSSIYFFVFFNLSNSFVIIYRLIYLRKTYTDLSDLLTHIYLLPMIVFSNINDQIFTLFLIDS